MALKKEIMASLPIQGRSVPTHELYAMFVEQWTRRSFKPPCAFSTFKDDIAKFRKVSRDSHFKTGEKIRDSLSGMGEQHLNSHSTNNYLSRDQSSPGVGDISMVDPRGVSLGHLQTDQQKERVNAFMWGATIPRKCRKQIIEKKVSDDIASDFWSEPKKLGYHSPVRKNVSSESLQTSIYGGGRSTNSEPEHGYATVDGINNPDDQEESCQTQLPDLNAKNNLDALHLRAPKRKHSVEWPFSPDLSELPKGARLDEKTAKENGRCLISYGSSLECVNSEELIMPDEVEENDFRLFTASELREMQAPLLENSLTE